MPSYEPLLSWTILAGAFLIGFGGLVWALRRRKRRRLALAAAAQRLGLEFQADARSLAQAESRALHIFSQGRGRLYRNILNGKPEGTEGLVLCDYHYTTGDGKDARTLRQTVALLRCPNGALPRFELRPRDASQEVDPRFGYQDIGLESSPAFSQSYLLRGPDEAAVRSFFGADLRRHFAGHAGWCVDGRGAWLAAYRHDRLVEPEELPAFLDEIKLLWRALPR